MKELQELLRGPVHPLQIIDDNNQRLFLGLILMRDILRPQMYDVFSGWVQ